MRKWLGFSLFVTSLMIAAQSALALPPSVIWIRPTNGAVFTANSTILLTARAVATNSTVGVVEFYANSNLVGMVAASPTNATGIYNLSWPNVAAGVYRLHAEAVNNLGERGVSGSVQITVNTNTPPPPTNAAPVVNWIRPTNGAVFPPGAAIFMTATATDSDGSISFVDFFANSNLLGRGTWAPSSGFYNFVWSNAPPGIHRLHAEAVDNVGAHGSAGFVQITVGGGTNNVPPTIVSQPQSQTVNEGETVTFSVTATGTPPLSYQWRRNNVAIPGVTGPSLTLSNVTSLDAGVYSVIVSNLFGSRISSNAVLTVISEPGSNSPPVVTLISPSNGMTFPAGQPIILRAFASDPDGTVAFVDFFANTTRVARAFSTTALFSTVWSNAAPGTYQIHAEAQDNAGAGGSSGFAQIMVVGGTNNVPPTIVTQPQSQTVNEGDTVTFTVVATGTPPLGYRWRRNNVIIPGATTPTLTLSNVTSANAGAYSVIVSNLFGSRISSNAVLTVISEPGSNSPPVVTLINPSNGMTFPAGVPIFLRAQASDPDGTVAFVDFFANTSRVARAFSTTGLFSAVWTNTAPGDYQIRAAATDNQGAQTASAPASITVLAPPNDPPVARITIENTVTFLGLQSIITTMQDSNGNPRAVVTLDGAQSSDPDGDPLTYHWFVGDQGLGSGVRINTVLPPGSYDFHLLVSDGALSGTNSAHLAVLTPCDAIGLLIIRIAESSLHRSDTRPLIRALESSCEDFERGDIVEGVAGLESFQHKVQVRLGRTDPAFAALLIEAAQTVIDAIGPN